MNHKAQSLMQALFPCSPYEGFPYQEYALDLRNEPEHPLFRKFIELTRPNLIVEIGSWKGDSAITMADILKSLNLECAILCVDTWLGSLEHFINRDLRGWEMSGMLKHGYPTLYRQFLANVCHKQACDYIVPLPNTSSMAARWLAVRGEKADMVYVDGSHEFQDVYLDLLNYWPLLRPNGIMFGDDYCCAGVIRAVNRFAEESRLEPHIQKEKWSLLKPPI